MSDDYVSIIFKALEDRFSQKGDSFKMKHEFKMNGEVCTDDSKGPAMSVTRDTTGWVWHCHRCKESGFIGDKFVNPVNTLKKLNQKPSLPKETYIVKLPDDFIPLVNNHLILNKNIPFESHSWLWHYNITEKDMFDFGFGWSEKCQMVILPLYSSDIRVLNGWIGRKVLKKDEGNKYHIQKPKGNKERLYFIVEGEDDGQIIIVEDCLSAIRVNRSTGITTIALLTTSIDEDMTRKLRGKEVYIWLDADALAKSVAMVTRFRQLGIKAKHIYTSKDPKCYNNVAIKELWNQVYDSIEEE